jgi:LmbE family N-acetylglucosaminyl deacetylase
VPVELTRKEFLATLAAPAVVPDLPSARTSAGKLLIVVAHPDDEYACAATTYRLVRELGFAADQIVITNGEGGYRYSTLAETIYGKHLAPGRDGRSDLTGVRREETLRAGRILGIEHHRFLDQRDLGFAADPATADAGYWDRNHVLAAIRSALSDGAYDLVLTLLPTADTHTHHREAARLTVEAAASLPDASRPLVLGAVPCARSADPVRFEGAGPVLEFDRASAFGYHDSLDYQIVVNWVIAEYKSQGLFQKDCGKHDLEQFWTLAHPGERAARVLSDLQARLRVPAA